MTATKAWCDGALEQRTELLETAQRSRQRGDWQMTQTSGYRSARRAEEPSGWAMRPAALKWRRSDSQQ
jgi:hypothetical protein